MTISLSTGPAFLQAASEFAPLSGDSLGKSGRALAIESPCAALVASWEMAWFKESLSQLEVGQDKANSPDPVPKVWGGECPQPFNQCLWLLMVGLTPLG